MSRPGHETDYVRTARTKEERRALRRMGKGVEGTEGVRHGDAAAVGAGCDAFFKRHGLRPAPLVFGRADLRRSV